MKKYLYLLAGLAAGFVLVFMGTAICQYLHLTQSGYVRYDDSVEVVYQQVAEYAGVDPATLSIHASGRWEMTFSYSGKRRTAPRSA